MVSFRFPAPYTGGEGGWFFVSICENKSSAKLQKTIILKPLFTTAVGPLGQNRLLISENVGHITLNYVNESKQFGGGLGFNINFYQY